MPEDVKCFSCGRALDRRSSDDGTFMGKLASPGTPGWAYLFIGLCALIPVVALGGCIPVMLGFMGASACLGISRQGWLPVLVKVPLCLVVTAACWLAFAAMIAAVMEMSKS
jgi:hypothetical protein